MVTVTYACDTWTLSKQMEAKIEAFEVWSYRTQNHENILERDGKVMQSY